MQQIVSMIVRSATCNNMKILDSPNYSRQLAPAISIQWFIAGTLTAATALIFFLRRWASGSRPACSCFSPSWKYVS